MAGARILVVDDEPEIGRALRVNLTAHGYDVTVVTSGEAALERLRVEHPPDLMILDLGLPGISGLEVCRRVRETSALPIIVLSVKGEEHDKVAALDLGADDYIAKPFGMNELLARVRVALRHAARPSAGASAIFSAGDLAIDFDRRLVTLSGQEVKLTPTEYDLLKALATHPGKIMTRHMLLDQVWGAGYLAEPHYLHVYIGQLRRKIEPDPLHPRYILTVPGVGYRFNAD
jgi:two-component system KDP operon response regulator KdpE